MGIAGSEYEENARRAFGTITKMIGHDGDDLLIGNVVIGTGVSHYNYYVSQRRQINDLHGVGAFLMMCCEYYKYFDNK